MNVTNQQTVTVQAVRRRSFSSKRRGLWLVVALALVIICLWANAGAMKRLVPIGWFREIPAVTQLHPVVAENRDRLVALSDKIGIHVVVTDEFRSSAEQDALYRKGRGAEGEIVTQVKGGESFHNYGLAIDFALGVSGGKVIWDLEYDGNRNGKSDWMEVVAVAKKLGFTWGGDWAGFRDYPHLQMDFGYSISQLQRGWRPPENG